MPKCIATNRFGAPCEMRVVKDNLCFSHSQIAHLRVRLQQTGFKLDEVDRMGRLTICQRQALDFLCTGETDRSAARILGIVHDSFSTRVRKAMKRAGVKTRLQLIALYSVWRVQNGELHMP